MATTTRGCAVDDVRDQAREFADYLHEVAALTGDARMADAAVCLDGYRAGLNLATPHPDTGFVLVPASMAASGKVWAAKPERRELVVVVSRIWLGFWEANTDEGEHCCANSMLAALHGLAEHALGGANYYATRLEGEGEVQTWRVTELLS